MPELGELIRYHRGRAGMTQEGLAERARVSPTTVVRMENGEIGQPRIATLQKLAAALGIDAGELYGAAATPPDSAGSRLEFEGASAFTAVYQRDGDWWIGYVEELPGANAQERTLEEARSSLKEAVADVLEANRELTRTEFEGREVVREPLSV